MQAVVKRRLNEDGEEVRGADSKSYDEVDVVYLIEDGKAAVHQVVVGISDVLYVEIIERLAVDDEVVIGPYRTLKNMKHGDAVKVEEKKSDTTSAEEENSGGVEVRVD